MIITMSGKDRTGCKAIFDQLFRLRYEVFVAGMGWSLPTRCGLEIDQYDNADAQYFYGLDAEGRLISHVRLTPSKTASLIADCFPHLVDGAFDVRSDTVFEGTRYIVKPVERSRRAVRTAKAELLVAMFSWARQQGGTQVQVIVETKLLPTFLEMTPEVRPMGLSKAYGGGCDAPGGGEAIAIRCPITDKVIADLREFGGLVNGIELVDGRSALAAAA